MTLQIKYNKNKVIQALRYHFLSRMEIKLLLILVNVFAIISAILLSVKLIRPTPFLVSSFLWFVLMISFWFVLPWLVYKRTKTFTEDISINLEEKGMLLNTGDSVANWHYTNFKYYIETPHFFHIYVNDKSFFLLPKDACTNLAELNNLKQMLDNKIGKK